MIRVTTTRIGKISIVLSPGGRFAPSEQHLLEDLADHAGLALHNVRLTEVLRVRLEEISARADALRRSRERVETARDEQRRKLEREVREGAHVRLLAIIDRLDMAAEVVDHHPDGASSIMDELSADTNATLEELRDLARGVFPPLLVDRGIAPALEAHVRKEAIPAALEIADGVRAHRFDPEVEAALFFCCVQSLQNAARHAGGGEIAARLDRDQDAIVFTVSDRSSGLDAGSTPDGMDLQIMRDRIEALDGTFEVRSEFGQGRVIAGSVPALMLEEAGS